MTDLELAAIENRLGSASPGPWKHESYGSGTEYVHMRHASCKDGPTVFGPDKSDQDGHVGAHMHLYNVAAFLALTGEDEAKMVREKHANAEFIAHSRQDVEDLLLEVRRLRKQMENRGE